MWVVSAGLVRMCRCCLNRQQFRGSDWQLWMSISLIVTGCYRPEADVRNRLLTANSGHRPSTKAVATQHERRKNSNFGPRRQRRLIPILG